MIGSRCLILDAQAPCGNDVRVCLIRLLGVRAEPSHDALPGGANLCRNKHFFESNR
jgi:hypothetical protein